MARVDYLQVICADHAKQYDVAGEAALRLPAPANAGLPPDDRNQVIFDGVVPRFALDGPPGLAANSAGPN